MATKWESHAWIDWFPAGEGRRSPVVSGLILSQTSLTIAWGDPTPSLRVYYLVVGGANACGLKPPLQAAFPGLVVKSAIIPAGQALFSVTPGPPDPPDTIVCP